jgi:hypothetical protein
VTRRCVGCLVRPGFLVLCTLLCCHNLSLAQDEEIAPGHPIGKVSTDGNLVVMELAEGALGKANLFDIVGLNWDPDFGAELAGAEVALHQFAFPFSGKKWDSFFVGTTGSISFGTREKDDVPDSSRR